MHVLALCGGFWCVPERPSVDGGAGAALAVRAWARKGAGVVMGGMSERVKWSRPLGRPPQTIRS